MIRSFFLHFFLSVFLSGLCPGAFSQADTLPVPIDTLQPQMDTLTEGAAFVYQNAVYLELLGPGALYSRDMNGSC